MGCMFSLYQYKKHKSGQILDTGPFKKRPSDAKRSGRALPPTHACTYTHTCTHTRCKHDLQAHLFPTGSPDAEGTLRQATPRHPPLRPSSSSSSCHRRPDYCCHGNRGAAVLPATVGIRRQTWSKERTNEPRCDWWRLSSRGVDRVSSSCICCIVILLLLLWLHQYHFLTERVGYKYLYSSTH